MDKHTAPWTKRHYGFRCLTYTVCCFNILL